MKIKQKDMTLIVMKQVKNGKDCEMWHGLAVILINIITLSFTGSCVLTD